MGDGEALDLAPWQEDTLLQILEAVRRGDRLVLNMPRVWASPRGWRGDE